MPPRIENSSGQIRRVGVELEYAGVSLKESADLIQSLFGGQVKSLEASKIQVIATDLGDFNLELDASGIQGKAYMAYLKQLGFEPEPETADKIDQIVVQAATWFVPFEIVAPPIPLTKIGEMERLREALLNRQAKDTRSSLLYAFGLQFNPEIPDAKTDDLAPVLLAYLRAFLLLYDWLFDKLHVDIARRVAPFIHPFPAKFVEFALEPSYRPDLRAFITDYLRFNPTRNRPLDFLPLFKHLAPDLVAAHPVEHHLVKARPTFHYRLPNSLVADPRWTITQEWNDWVEVERLAFDPERIRAMTEDYLRIHKHYLLRARSNWLVKAREWMNETEL